MVTLLVYGALFGFAFGLASRPLADSADQWWGRWRAPRSWRRTSAPWAGSGVRIERVQGPMRKLVPEVIDLTELNMLFDAAWGSPKPAYAKVLDHSFGWVAFRDDGVLLGFVNIAWDGGDHFFLLDTTVHPGCRRQKIASSMIEAAVEMCRGKGEWLHVDAPVELMEGLYRPQGFEPTPAGLISLRAAA